MNKDSGSPAKVDWLFLGFWIIVGIALIAFWGFLAIGARHLVSIVF